MNACNFKTSIVFDFATSITGLTACLDWYTGRQGIFFLTKRFTYDPVRRREMERVLSDDRTVDADPHRWPGVQVL